MRFVITGGHHTSALILAKELIKTVAKNATILATCRITILFDSDIKPATV